jgi:uncharacterized Tic20 family protein
VTENTPIDPLPGDGPPQAIPPAAGAPANVAIPPAGASAAIDTSDGQARTFAMLCHLSAFSALIGIPFGNILGPLVVWLVKRDELPMVEHQGKESLNFQISMTIYLIVAGLLSLVLIGIPILIGLVIAWFVLVIVGSVRANGGELYRYPITIRFIN